MGMDPETKMQCIGGWGFLSLALGLFMTVPSFILLGSYASFPWVDEKIAAVVLTCLVFVFIIMGSAMAAYWCVENRKLKEKDPEQDNIVNASQNNNIAAVC